jgi:hypothetical protein
MRKDICVGVSLSLLFLWWSISSLLHTLLKNSQWPWLLTKIRKYRWSGHSWISWHITSSWGWLGWLPVLLLCQPRQTLKWPRGPSQPVAQQTEEWTECLGSQWSPNSVNKEPLLTQSLLGKGYLSYWEWRPCCCHAWTSQILLGLNEGWKWAQIFRKSLRDQEVKSHNFFLCFKSDCIQHHAGNRLVIHILLRILLSNLNESFNRVFDIGCIKNTINLFGKWRIW